ncbi:MAG: FtsX-like permease family protein [Candidatus Dormibacteraeota bacterium]|nr:FtsX-like permease family protein [Candidatus Dormibacteraeota bacterium]
MGVGLILGTSLTAAALQQQLRQAARSLIGNTDAEVFAFSEKGFSQGMVDVVSKLPEVSAAAPVVSKRLSGSANGKTVSFQMLGIDPDAEQRLHPYAVSAGSDIAVADKAAVLLDDKWAQGNGVGVGSKLTLFTSTGPDEYTVKGLVRNSSFSQSSFGPVVFVPLAQAQKAFSLGARVTQVSVALNSTCPGSYSDCTYGPFRQDLRGKATEEYTVRDNRAFIGGQRDPYLDIQPVLVFFAIMALGIGLFLIYNNMAVTVMERRREIGLLRAAGATPGWIRALFLVQAAILGVFGTALGLALGLLVARQLIEYLRGASGQPGIQFVFDPRAFALVALLGVVATVICAVLPATRAMGVAPLEAIRPEAGVRVERARRQFVVIGAILLLAGLGLLVSIYQSRGLDAALTGTRLGLAAAAMVAIFAGTLMLTPLILRPLSWILSRPFEAILPVETRLARNTIIRRPNRSSLTIAGLLVSTALVVAVAGLSQGAEGAGDAWVNSLFVSDHLIVSPVHQGEQIRQEINKVEGVRATSPVNFLTVKSGDRALNLAAIDPLDYASRQRFQFVDGSGAGPFTEIENSRALFLPRNIATARNLKVGDPVPLTGSVGDVNYRVAAIVQHALPSPGGDETAIISLANGRQDFGTDGFNILQVVPTDNPPPGFIAALDTAAQKYGMQLESVADVRAGVRRGLDQLLVLLASIGLVGVILGLLSVATTILLNISESGRELALLRSVGATRAQVRNIILTESGLFGLFGALLGTGVGLLLVALMVRAATSLGFQPTYVAPWNVIVAVVLIATVGSLLAVILPARRASRASVVASLRYE